MPLTAQEKSDLGFTPTEEDIKTLLKDPNSWVYKLWVECQEIVAISEAQFIQYLSAIFREQNLQGLREEANVYTAMREKIEELRLQQLREAAELDTKAAKEDEKDDHDFDAPLSTEQLAQIGSRLNTQANKLAAMNQLAMTQPQLIAHHANLSKTMGGLAAVKLAGTSGQISLSTGTKVNVNPLKVKATPSINKILEVTKLGPELRQDPARLDGFITFHTLNEVGPTRVFSEVGRYREQAEAKDINFTLGEIRELTKLIDASYKAVNQEHAQLTKTNYLNNLLIAKPEMQELKNEVNKLVGAFEQTMNRSLNLKPTQGSRLTKDEERKQTVSKKPGLFGGSAEPKGEHDQVTNKPQKPRFRL